MLHVTTVAQNAAPTGSMATAPAFVPKLVPVIAMVMASVVCAWLGVAEKLETTGFLGLTPRVVVA